MKKEPMNDHTISSMFFSLPIDLDFNLPQGVYIFLGYSTKDEQLLKAVTKKGIDDSVADIHGLAYHYNMNNDKVHMGEFFGGDRNYLSTSVYCFLLSRVSVASFEGATKGKIWYFKQWLMCKTKKMERICQSWSF